MGGQPTYIKGTVAPGATYDISVNLTAPTQPGVYQGFWQMNNGKGTAFGTKIYVGIQVLAPTPTPAPTSPPSPSISFTVDTTNITAGECVVFSWNVQNVQGRLLLRRGTEPAGARRRRPGQPDGVPASDHDVLPDRGLSQQHLADTGDHDQRGAGAGRRTGDQPVLGDAAADHAGPVRDHPVGRAGQRAARSTSRAAARSCGAARRSRAACRTARRAPARSATRWWRRARAAKARRSSTSTSWRRLRRCHRRSAADSSAANSRPTDSGAAYGRAADCSPADGCASASGDRGQELDPDDLQQRARRDDVADRGHRDHAPCLARTAR